MKKTLETMLCKLMTPVVQLVLRQGMSFGEFGHILKRVYVAVAERQLLASEGKASTSRIAILTGLTRKDVSLLRKQQNVLKPGDDGKKATSRYNRSVRVISGWLEDAEFTSPDGFPRALPIQGEMGSFESLVSRYSGDMPVRAMLDELERVGVVEKIGKEHVSLLRHAYIPEGDELEQLSILGEDVPLLIETIQHNLNRESETRRFQRKVCYDNLPAECLQPFQKMINQNGQKLLEALNQFLAQHDRDQPEQSSTGVQQTEKTTDTKPASIKKESGKAVTSHERFKAGVGIYYFEKAITEETQCDEFTKDAKISPELKQP